MTQPTRLSQPQRAVLDSLTRQFVKGGQRSTLEWANSKTVNSLIRLSLIERMGRDIENRPTYRLVTP